MNKSSFRLSPLVPLVSALFVIGAPAAQAVGLQQSPIEFTSSNTVFDPNLPKLNFNLSSDAGLKVINNGSGEFNTAVRANLDDPSASTLTVNGHNYTLSQFHFHAPAEHLVSGSPFPMAKFPMEMHLVFQDANKNLLVVGRWVEQGAFNQTLDPIFSHIPQDTTTTLPISHFNLNALLPDHLNSFRYDGSLTTPPFSEGVKWVDLATPLDMSAAQINAFSSMFAGLPNGDAREVQALNGRTVLTDLPGFTMTAVPEPEAYAMMLVGLGLIGFMAKRKRRVHLEPGVLPA